MIVAIFGAFLSVRDRCSPFHRLFFSKTLMIPQFRPWPLPIEDGRGFPPAFHRTGDLSLRHPVPITTSVMNDAMAATTSMNMDRNAQSDSEILTILEVARFLRVPKSTVYKLARLGQLPASKIGKHWRFLRRDIHDWVHSRGSQS
jgi:excisionase family DNA binding protein